MSVKSSLYFHFSLITVKHLVHRHTLLPLTILLADHPFVYETPYPSRPWRRRCLASRLTVFSLTILSSPSMHLYTSYDCLVCGKKCTSSGGLLRHRNSKHQANLLPEEINHYTRIHHPHLTGMFFGPFLCF
jgi:hypothetical protein